MNVDDIVQSEELKADATPPRPPEKVRRIGFVDGLRGLAMLQVLGFHQRGFTDGGKWIVAGIHIPNPFAFGYLGVHLFLVISGFCLAWPYSGPTRKSMNELTLKAFITRRFIRLAPAYYVILLLSAVPVMLAALVKTGTIAPQIWQDLFAHLFWIHNLSSDYLGGFNMAMWSLALEVQLYLFFPVFLYIRDRFGLLALVAPVVLLQLLYRHAVAPLLSYQDWALDYSIAYAVPGRMVEFVAGIAVATIVRDMAEKTIPQWRHWALAGLWFLTGGIAFKITLTRGMLQPDVDVLWGLFFALTLFMGFTIAWWGKLLANRALVFCGICSYSIYLIHHPVGLWLHLNFYDDGQYSYWLRGAVMCLYPVIMILLGWFCYRLLERPFLRTGSR